MSGLKQNGRETNLKKRWTQEGGDTVLEGAGGQGRMRCTRRKQKFDLLFSHHGTSALSALDFINLFIFYFYLFIFGCVGSSLLRASFLYLRRAGATLRCSAWASHCGGFSCVEHGLQVRRLQ